MRQNAKQTQGQVGGEQLTQAIEQGLKLYHPGHVEKALDYFQNLLAQHPRVPDIYNMLGNLCQQEQQFDQAIAYYQQGIEVDPEPPYFYNGLGASLSQMGKHQEALAYYVRAIELDPAYGEAYYNQGNSLKNLKQYDAALACYEQALVYRPQFADAYHNLGWVLKELGQWEAALPYFDKTLTFQPDHTEALNNKGNTLHLLKHYTEAIACYKEALRLKPDFYAAQNGLASAISSLGDYEQAISLFQDLLAAQPDYDIAYYNLGNAYATLKQFPQALAAYQKAVALNPDYVEAHWNLALNSLKVGDYPEGWRQYEWRLQKSDSHPKRPLTRPMWDGKNPQNRTILVLCEQGLGDMLQFCRFVPLLKALGARVILECQPELFAFFKGLPGVDQLVVKTSRAEPEVAYDAYIYMMSLPRIFNTTLQTIPPIIRYMQFDSALFSKWKARLASEAAIKIGFVWGGNRENPTHVDRSCPVAAFLDLARSWPQATFYSLQKGPTTQELTAQPDLPANCIVLDDDIINFADTACAILQMDLVITVDTAVAHLAGMLYRPTWVLLTWNPDWRWLTQGTSSPWYPTAKLFRQPYPNDWPAIFAALHQALEAVIPAG